MKNILILGGAGFIGFNIAKFLFKNRDCKLTLVDNLFRGKMDKEFTTFVNQPRVKFITCDLTNAESFERLKEKYDQVYLLASMVGVEYVEKVPHEIIRANTQIILNTAEWLRSGFCSKILFTSTSECYAGAIESFDYKVPTDEMVPLVISDISHPRFTYAVTKMLGESTFLNYARALGIEATIIRYHNVYGPRMGFKHVIPQMVERFYKKENPFKIYGSDQTRAFNFIEDAVQGTVQAMESKNTNQEIFHIGDSRFEITIKELAQFIGEQMKFNGDFVDAGLHSGSVSRRCPDISKAERVLGYKPNVDWKNGVAQTVKWYKEYFEFGHAAYE